jgi:hypothetical protein
VKPGPAQHEIGAAVSVGTAIVVRHGSPRRLTPWIPWLHQALNLAARNALAGPNQRLPGTAIPVGLIVGPVYLPDALQQPLVGGLKGRTLTAATLVVGGRRHGQTPTDRLDRDANR